MADSSTNNDPVEPPRENLISTAVTFLQNPKVTQSLPSQKRTFLEKKGLTNEEIDLAFARAGVSEVAVPAAGNQAITSVPQGAVYHQGAPVGPLAVQVPESRWTKVRDYTATIIVVGGVSYGIYQLYKKYLMPLWYGPSKEEQQFKALEKSVEDLQQNISEMLSCIKDMQSSQQRQINNMSATSVPMNSEVDRIFVNEVKDEIKSLKGLMLSRKQFPPPPVTQPVLPAWQLAASAKTGEDIATTATSDTAAASGVNVQAPDEVVASDNTSSETSANTASSHVVTADQEMSNVITDNQETSSNCEVSPALTNGHLQNGLSDELGDQLDTATAAASKSHVPTDHPDTAASKSHVPTEPTVKIENRPESPAAVNAQEITA